MRVSLIGDANTLSRPYNAATRPWVDSWRNIRELFFSYPIKIYLGSSAGHLL